MYYSVNVDSSLSAFAHCIQKVNNGICNVEDWEVTIDTTVNYGIYFNFDLEEKTLEITSNSLYKELDSLDEIIEIINKEYEEE